MNSQIDVTGILGTELITEEQNVGQPENNTTITTPQTYYSVLPKTNEYINFYLFGLGVTICLIILVLHQINKKSL